MIIRIYGKKLVMNNSTNIQYIIEGCLLGDGHLELSKNGKNASFQYGSSSEEHVKYVQNFFIEYCSENNKVIKRREIYDKRTDKTYVNYSFRTSVHSLFTEQHRRFYINRIKVVPNDIKLNDELLRLWYIGDGELEKKYEYVKLHTNSFTYNEVLFLCNLLSIFEAKPLKKNSTQYLVSIPRKKVKSFLEYIGECPINDYKHKWEFVPYKNKNIENNGFNNYNEIYPQIITDHLSGGYTLYGLSKKYDVPIKAIKNHFNRNDVSWKPVITKKEIIQYDLDGNYLKTWESGQEIKRVLGYNATAVSECCRNIRKTYKKSIWIFKKLHNER